MELRSKTALEAALEYIEQGWSVIPINPDTKRPLIRWREFQSRIAEAEEVEQWFDQWPNASLAVVTGAISGICIVDTDNPDAERYAREHGLAQTPITAKTKNGRHFYWAHPCDGKHRGPRAGVNVRRSSPDWPAVRGLDFRGDHSYALLPPSPNYAWEGLTDVDELPTWSDDVALRAARGAPPSDNGEFDFADLDLSALPALDGRISEWDRTALYVREHFPETLRLPSGCGHGRNERVMRHASDCILEGYWGAELRHKVAGFMREFFEEPLPPLEAEATCASVEQMERRNHPERFDAEGNYIPRPPSTTELAPVSKEPLGQPRLLYTSDAEDLLKTADARTYLIEPWLRKGTICQFYAYSGHGKSTVIQHLLFALAAGMSACGPFDLTGHAAKTLYLDYENGPGTIGTRLTEMREMYGDPGERFAVWTPFITEGEDMNLRTKDGIEQLDRLIRYAQPEVIVIDTIRSAFLGLPENDAAEWANLNQLAIKLRNAGFAVILVHHGNKPGEGGLGREAGSTNQLTTLETQIRITQVYKDKETARINAGIHDASYEIPVWPQLQGMLPLGSLLNMVVEIRYGKVREWTDMHTRTQWMGWGTDAITGERYVVGTEPPKRTAFRLAGSGCDPVRIANQIERPVRTVKQWLGLPV